MAAAVTASPNPAKGYTTVTLSVTGAAATTAHTVTIAGPGGHTASLPMTTDGSGAGSVKYVPSSGGGYTVNVYATVQVSVANTSFNSSGSST